MMMLIMAATTTTMMMTISTVVVVVVMVMMMMMMMMTQHGNLHIKLSVITSTVIYLSCGPTQEPVSVTANTREKKKARRGFGKNEGEWPGKAEF